MNAPNADGTEGVASSEFTSPVTATPAAGAMVGSKATGPDSGSPPRYLTKPFVIHVARVVPTGGWPPTDPSLRRNSKAVPVWVATVLPTAEKSPFTAPPIVELKADVSGLPAPSTAVAPIWPT